MEEEWKDVVGYEGLYEVSNMGQVKSLITNRILKSGINSAGYLHVTLCSKGKHTTTQLHRLVLKHFSSTPKNNQQCMHKDNNKQNNQIYNLKWGTQSENTQDAYDTGRIKLRYGCAHHRSKFSRTQIIKIRKLFNTGEYTRRKLAVCFNVSHTTINRIISKERYDI